MSSYQPINPEMMTDAERRGLAAVLRFSHLAAIRIPSPAEAEEYFAIKSELVNALTAHEEASNA